MTEGQVEIGNSPQQNQMIKTQPKFEINLKQIEESDAIRKSEPDPVLSRTVTF